MALFPTTGGIMPPTQVPNQQVPYTANAGLGLGGQFPVQQGGYDPSNLPDAGGLVNDSLSAILNPNSAYIQNARQNGINYAAERGGVNSSIAAGASQKAAVDAAAPLAQQVLQIQGARENVQAQNFLSGQDFNRQFQGTLAMAPLNNSMDMLKSLQNYAMQDPALFTPDVISGYSNFFSKNADDIFKSYFGGL